MNISHKENISILLIWLFTISGIIGILLPNYSEWFLSLTPLNLAVLFVLFLWNLENFNTRTFTALLIPFLLGFFTEFLGVNYGLIFGNYSYGNNLGIKFWGVPFIICINWALLTAVTSEFSVHYLKHKFMSAALGASLMTLLDLIIEVSAPRFDFWEFEGGTVPLQNYAGWFITAFVAHLCYQHFKVQASFKISWHILVSLLFFFMIFLFL
jgi:putative membrane protein